MTYAGQFIDQGDLFKVFYNEATNDILVECRIGTSINAMSTHCTFEECDPYLQGRIEKLLIEAKKDLPEYE